MKEKTLVSGMDQKHSLGRTVNKYWLNMEVFLYVIVHALRIPHVMDFPVEKCGMVAASYICVFLRSYYSNSSWHRHPIF